MGTANDILTTIRALVLIGARSPEGRAMAPPEPELWEIISDTQTFAKLVVEAYGLPVEELAESLAERLVEGWDRWGAPTTARTSKGTWVGSFEGPGEPYTVEAESRREAYRKARREWFRRLLKGEVLGVGS